MYQKTGKVKKTPLRGAPRPGGAWPKAAPYVFLTFLVFLDILRHHLKIRMLVLPTGMLNSWWGARHPNHQIEATPERDTINLPAGDRSEEGTPRHGK